MTSFFRGLIEGILSVFWRQYAAAQNRGYVPELFFLCGGPARNRWFAKCIFDEIQKREPGMTCASETHVGTVAQGALSFAENPFLETSVAGEDVGMTFLMDLSHSGDEWSEDRVKEAIGWGQPAGEGSRVVLIKEVYRDRPGRPNRIISSDLYTTTERFNREKIRSDHDVDWDCRITYPLDGVRSHLVYLGSIEADIPHAELFPPHTTHRDIEARFEFSIKRQGQLLKVEVSLQREDDSRLLRRSYVPAASWTPQSELDLEQGRHSDPLAFFPPGRSKRRRRRRGARGTRLLPAVEIRGCGDSSVPERQAMRSPRTPSSSPSIAPTLKTPSVAAEMEAPSASVDRRPAEHDTCSTSSALPGRPKSVRRSLVPKNMSYLLSPLPGSAHGARERADSIAPFGAPTDTHLELAESEKLQITTRARRKATALRKHTKAS
ncbi:hypothetical protein N7523_005554 [Penicillium sp. IBT 18751x]|nr:hypothetical protein N7523_005861 [Penicillium sp. IBT 18751x]KAJ6117803.1 hypothetical protein N7523_005554 [Penicillium sp. IBT 18751x]